MGEKSRCYQLAGWRKAPIKLPFSRWKLRFGKWKCFWSTKFGRWKYLSAEKLGRLNLPPRWISRKGGLNKSSAFPKQSQWRIFKIFSNYGGSWKNLNQKWVSLFANNTTYKVTETVCLVKYVWSCLQKNAKWGGRRVIKKGEITKREGGKIWKGGVIRSSRTLWSKYYTITQKVQVLGIWEYKFVVVICLSEGQKCPCIGHLYIVFLFAPRDSTFLSNVNKKFKIK